MIQEHREKNSTNTIIAANISLLQGNCRERPMVYELGTLLVLPQTGSLSSDLVVLYEHMRGGPPKQNYFLECGPFLVQTCPTT